MQKAIWSILTVLAILAYAGVARADEPKSDQSKAEEPKKESVEDRQQDRKEAVAAAVSGQDFDKALAVLEEIIGDKEVSDDEKFEATFGQFRILVEGKHDGAKACPLAKKLSEAKKDNADVLNELAWTIIVAEDLKNRDLDLALTIAKQAAEVTKYERGDVLDTLARAHYAKGDLDQAIDFQTKAVENWRPDPRLDDEQNENAKKEIKGNLAKYKAEKAKPKS
jgi:tetratricopeptide (TPR) repeat protein